MANDWPDPTKLILSSHQKTELAKSFAGRFGLFTGAPGVGKTHTIARVISAVTAEFGEAAVRVVAPTGKASNRASRSLRSQGIFLPATTIHRALGVQEVTESGVCIFNHNASNPLTSRFVIVDEASMLGNSLGASLFSAIPTGSNVLLVGDHHQLPPVERGCVLRDCIQAGLPQGDLHEIFRNSGDIVACCARIREGQPFMPSERPVFGTENNLALVERSRESDAVAELQYIYERLETNKSIDPLWGIQVLTYMNKGTAVAREELNAMLQKALNPSGNKLNDSFRFGDKVMCLKNSIYRWTGPEGEDSEFVANGQMAILESLDSKGSVVLALEPENDVVRRIHVTKKALSEVWTLAYAVSVHKAQGSSWPIVVVMVDSSNRARFMGNRQIIYTAISRAEKYCIVIGQRRDIDTDCRQDAIANRTTRLASQLQERIYNAQGVPCWAGL